MAETLDPTVSGRTKSGSGTVTAWGWLVLVGLLVTPWAGWLLGWAEFRVLFVICFVVAAVAVASVMGRSEHRAQLVLDRPRVVAGETATGEIRVWPAGARTSGSASLEFPVDAAVANFRVAALQSGAQHIEQFTIPTSVRTVMTIGPVRSVLTDPLALASRTKKLCEPVQLFVHPKVVLLEAGAVGFLRDIEGIATSNLSSSDVTFHTLREYRPGDDRRSVHWRTTARTGMLMVRQFEETMRAHLLIVLSTLASDYQTPEDFELAVSVAGSLGVSALRQERQVTLCLSTGLVNFNGPIGLLDKLAGVSLTSDGGNLRQLVLQHAQESGVSVAAFVTGDTPAAQLRAAQLALNPGIVAFALRCRQAGSLTRRRVGDLVISDLTTLEDIRPVMASMT